MADELRGKRIAALVDNGFEQVELLEPRKALEGAGAKVDVISPQKSEVKGWNHTDWGHTVKVDTPLEQARPDEYDGLLLPGGVINPDKLRTDEKVLGLVKQFAEAGKPVAAICHGPWTLINAGLVKDRKVTSWPSVRKDLENAGAKWEDSEVVKDANFITSRKPDDIPAFANAVIEALAT